jgi:hypothetical protein
VRNGKDKLTYDVVDVSSKRSVVIHANAQQEYNERKLVELTRTLTCGHDVLNTVC